MSKERLELVRSFSELRAGMIVVLTCNACGGKHRGMAMNRNKLTCRYGGAEIAVEPAASPCGFRMAACECSVAAKHVHRVVDDLESPDTYHRSLSADEDLAKVRAHQRQKARAR